MSRIIILNAIKKRDNKVVALGNPSKPSRCSNHVLKQKLKKEHHLTGALQNQSNKHQNSQKPMLKAKQKKTKNIPVACLRQLFRLILRLIS